MDSRSTAISCVTACPISLHLGHGPIRHNRMEEKARVIAEGGRSHHFLPAALRLCCPKRIDFAMADRLAA